MKLKLFIWLLLLTFVASTTGITYSLDICKMKQSGVVKCSMCEEHNSKKKEHKVEYSAVNKCCSIKIIDVKVSDNFILTNNIDSHNDFCFAEYTADNSLIQKNYIPLSVDSSPPILSIPIYLRNSILII